MIDIINCTLDEAGFIIKGTYNNEFFHCRVEFRSEDHEDLDDIDYEHLDGIDLGPTELDVLEELANEIFETEVYQDVLEAQEKADEA